MNFQGKILLVDDEPHIRKFVGLILKSIAQPTIIEAVNGQEALRLYKEKEPDLVLLDVNMPVMDGVQTLGAIMALCPDAIVVMLTSLVNRQTVEECLRLGATGYIRKDTPREELSGEVMRIISDCFGDEQPIESPAISSPDAT